MNSARLRSTRSAWPCAVQGLAHSPRNGAASVSVTRVDDRPLSPSPSGEQSKQAERARQQGLLPVRAVTSVTGSEASKARPEGVALYLTNKEARQLQRSLERQLKAIRSSLAFWKHEISCFQTQPPFSLEAKEFEAELIQRLFLELYDITKTNAKHETAYKTAKYQEQ